MLLGQELLLLLPFPGAGLFLFPLEFRFLLAQRLHHMIDIALNARSLFQHYTRLLINFLGGFSQFYLGHWMLAPPHLSLFSP